MVTLRTLTSDDWAGWRVLRLAALRLDPDVFGATLAHWEDAPEERWRARLTDVPFNVLATPAGMVSATAPEGGAVELLSLWVAPAGRGRGVGDALVTAVLEWARSVGAESVRLRVYDHNARARDLYYRHGFSETGEPEILSRNLGGG
ncbi:GNAT family N-acetyltransferase [Amycolatopsis umgeniensis]|uniref:Ribosomal protein S18 acetylase RimI-like enzyme n=1 Tax=Amycolatopsis umgeniensis TaxID=336628 RepID=A0A841B5Q0_9PSEU|nr:N-acetyltransferase [Amycolatopsis umgeniensis]MBB5853824.1 ribosomal protein S18 acetylase RimI-like enzyme [Amycolatopsis umgeniensis]